MDKIKLVLIMLVWGSIGIFSRYIPLSPITLAFLRAVIAVPVLIAYIAIKKIKPNLSFAQIKPYIFSGLLLGIGWASLFYGYKNTSVASAVLIYNLCPIYVMIAAPFVLKEKLTMHQAIAIIVSFIGLILIVGIKKHGTKETAGILLSGISGLCYAAIVLINKKTKSKTDPSYLTLIQISTAAVFLLPFIVAQQDINNVITLDTRAIVLALVLGVVHTGISYCIYFSVYNKLKSLQIVLLGYLEPVFCIILGIIFLHEDITVLNTAGGLLILGSAYFAEKLKNKTHQEPSFEEEYL